MTANEYQKLAMRTNDGKCGERLHDFPIRLVTQSVFEHKSIKGGDLLNGVMGLNGEAGETIEIVKKCVFHGHELNIDELKKELGDVCWYVAMICNSLGINMDEVMEGNIDKLKKRYPNGFKELGKEATE